jgi:methionyl-tRNA formyltransferase
VTQPEDIRDAEFRQQLVDLKPTTAVVVAFGQIFPREILELPDHGCINVHASLLPRYRGAAPIQAAIIAGDPITGVTTMLMDEGLDTGPILLQREVEIADEETAGELATRLSAAGAELLIDTLEEQTQGRLHPCPQPTEGVSLARRLRRRDGVIDWQVRAEVVFNRLRGLTPWPGVSTTLRGQSVKVLWGRPVPGGDPGTEAPPGTFVGMQDDQLMVSCGQNTRFGAERLQRAGRKPLPAKAFANGERLAVGERFG